MNHVESENNAYRELRYAASEVKRVANLLEEVGMSKLADRLFIQSHYIFESIEVLVDVGLDRLDEQSKESANMMGSVLALAMKLDESEHFKNDGVRAVD